MVFSNPTGIATCHANPCQLHVPVAKHMPTDLLKKPPAAAAQSKQRQVKNSSTVFNLAQIKLDDDIETAGQGKNFVLCFP